MSCLYYALKHPYRQSGQWVNNINKAVRINSVIAEYKLKETEYSNDFMALQPAYTHETQSDAFQLSLNQMLIR